MKYIVLERIELCNMKKLMLVPLMCLICLAAMAQKGVLWDKVNNMPVAHVNLYTNNRGNVLATSSDSKGHFGIEFSFKTLIISHINYEKLKLTALQDTIFLTPNVNLLGEITIVNKEPKWIKEKLYSFLKKKKQLYQTIDNHLEYCYDKSNIGDTCGYAFHSEGLMYLPSLRNLEKDSMYQVCPAKNIIQYKDKTAGVDLYDMQLMLYENAVSELNSKFIRKHIFCENEAFKSTDKNVVQIVFWSDKFKDDKGTITMDTTQCVILDATRSTGLSCNLKEKMNAFVLSVFKAAIGHQYEDWTIDSAIHYEKINGIYYPSNLSYKRYEKRSYYDKFVTSKKKKRIEYFKNDEAILSLKTTTSSPLVTHYYDIPHDPHSAVIYIESKRHSRNNIAITKMPREYKLYEKD